MRRGEIFALAGLGLLLGIAVVVAWGRLGPEPGSRNPTGWLGLLAVVAPNDASKTALLLLLVPALFLLLVAWCSLLRLTAAGRLTTRSTGFVAACWSLPFAVGPVIGSRDAYAYVAQGELARRGLDPTRAVVNQLGPGPLLAAVDPRWRETRPPYGGVAIAIQRAAAGADSRPAVSLLVLRLIAVVAVICLVTVTAWMASSDRRPVVIAAMAANPLVLIHLVAGAHLDAVAAALLVAGLAVAMGSAAARAGVGAGVRALAHANIRRWTGIVLCTLGAMVKLPVGLGVVYLSICALVATGPSLAAKLRGLAGDVLAVALAVGLSMAVSGAGLGWIHNFGTPGRLRTGIAPADMAANLVRGLAWLVGLHPNATNVLSSARMAMALAGGLIALLLLLPRRLSSNEGPDHSPRWVPPSQDRLGLALLALGLLGPVLYGWYLAAALPLLALAASRCVRPAPLSYGELSPAAAGWTIVGLSAVLTFATIPSLGPVWSTLAAHPDASIALSIAAAVVIAAGLLLTTRAFTRLRAARLERARLAQPAPSV